jgi:hypothetical protein
MRATSRRGSILAADSRPATRGARDMGRRQPNHRLIKIHRTYTVEEAANALGLHKNTISRWTTQDLPVIDKRRPKLIHGEALVQFLIERRTKSKQPCQRSDLLRGMSRAEAPKRRYGGLRAPVERRRQSSRPLPRLRPLDLSQGLTRRAGRGPGPFGRDIHAGIATHMRDLYPLLQR